MDFSPKELFILDLMEVTLIMKSLVVSIEQISYIQYASASKKIVNCGFNGSNIECEKYC